MLIHCRTCKSVINNDCCECPWCNQSRQPVTGAAKKQFGLLAFLAAVTLIGVWLGFALRDSFR